MTAQILVPDSATIDRIQAPAKNVAARPPIFFVAAILFALLNLACGEIVREHLLRHPVEDDPNIVLAHYSNLTQAPDVVLLGSSVIRFPMWLSDIRHSSSIPDYDHYGWCNTLEKEIKSVSGKDISVFDLGINSAMSTDVYLIEDRLLRGTLKPKMIVYALCGRDFLDSLVPDETRTQPFDRLYQFHDLIKQDNIFRTSATEKLDLFLRREEPLYRYRWQCQEKAKVFIRRSLDKLLTPVYSAQYLKEQYFLEQTNKKTSPSELNKFAPADLPHNRDARWLNSIAEYEARYAKPNFEHYRRQKQALRHLAELARSRGIKILFVRLPVADTELALDPPGYLEAFPLSMRRIAQDENVKFIDLQKSHQYSSSDFFDIAHLNATGGDKLTHVLAREISEMSDSL